MVALKKELVRVFVFILLISALFVLNFWILLPVLIIFPTLILNVKNKRNGKYNIGNLVNYITNYVTKRHQ